MNNLYANTETNNGVHNPEQVKFCDNNLLQIEWSMFISYITV